MFLSDQALAHTRFGGPVTWRVAVALGLCLAISMIALALMLPSVPLALAGGLLLMLGVLVAFVALRPTDIFHPAYVVAAFIGLFTTGRTLYVLSTERVGPFYGKSYPLAGHERLFAQAVVAQFAGAALFAVGTAFVPVRSSDAPLGLSLPRPGRRFLLLSVLIAAALSLGTLAALVSQAGGLSNYLNDIHARQTFFAGKGSLLLLTSLLPAAALAWFAARAGTLGTGNQRALAVTLLLAAAAAAVGTGSRSTVLFLLVVPVMVILHLRANRLRVWIVALVGVVMFVGASTFREHLRGSDPGAQHVSTHHPLSVVTNTFASSDAELPDPVAVIRLKAHGLKNGVTFVQAFASPVPRALWPGKPVSASAQFSRLIDARDFSTTRVEMALTFAGELIWNFSWFGLLGFALVGYLAASAHRLAWHRRDDISALLYAAALGTVLILLRGDSFNTAIASGEVFIPALGLLAFSHRIGWSGALQAGGPEGRRPRASTPLPP